MNIKDRVERDGFYTYTGNLFPHPKRPFGNMKVLKVG